MSGVAASVRAEMALLGAVIIDPEAVGAVAGIVAPADFGAERLRLVYEAMLALHQRRVLPDYVALCTELEALGTMRVVGGDWVLTRLINQCPTSLYADHYARLVAEAGAARRRTALPEPAAGVPRRRWLGI